MPLRGESIGAAYVRILADGTGFPEDVEREFSKAEPLILARGRKDSEAYREGFNDEVDKHPLSDDLVASLRKGSGKVNAVGEFLGGDVMDGLEKEIEKRFGKNAGPIGQALNKNLRDMVAKGLDPSSLGAVLENNLGGLLRQATKDVQDAEQEQVRIKEAATKELEKQDRDRTASMNKWIVANKKFADDFRALETKRLNDSVSRTNKWVVAQQKFADDFRAIAARTRMAEEKEWRKTQDEINATIDKSLKEGYTHLKKANLEIAKTYDDAAKSGRLLSKGLQDVEKVIQKTTQAVGDGETGFGRFARSIDKIAESTGRASGKGSRNNFVNFVGGAAEGIVKLVGVIPKAIDGVLKFGNNLSIAGKAGFTAFSEAQAAGDGFFKSLQQGGGAAFSTLASLGSTGVPGILALAAAAVVAVVAIGPLVAIISGLAAAATALAASLTFGIIGALAPLVGLIAPISIAAGVLGLAFVGLGKKGKETLKQTLKPITDQLQALGAVARKSIFADLPAQTKELGDRFKTLKPLVKAAGTGISEFFTNLLGGTKDPAFVSFVDTFKVVLPGVLAQLGTIFRQTFKGLGGVFVALIPSVQTFLDYLDRITKRFSDFTTSAEGQDQLKNFFDRAATSAQSIFDLLGSIGGLLKTVFNAGAEPGNNIVDTLAQKVRDFNAFLQANPDALSKWFANGVQIIGDVGNALVGVSQIFGALDTDLNRRFAAAALQEIIVVAGTAAFALERIGTAARFTFNLVIFAIKGALNAMGSFIVGIAGVVSAFSLIPGVGKLFDGVSQKILTAGSNVLNLGNKIKFIPDPKIDMSGFNSAINGAKTDVGRLRNQIDNLPNSKEIDILIAIAVRASVRAAGIAGASATGGIFNGAQTRLIGEAGPEAIVPLNRNLSQVDPAVRELSAIAQGKKVPGSVGTGTGRSIDASGWTIVSQSKDPATVARETFNHLVAGSY